ncbi:MAG: FAD-dependent oxidoreductase [Gaiellaceae bacterium]
MSDVCVYGATAAGVAAAVAARDAGAATTLVEPGRHVGGMVSGGLSWTDVGDTRVIRGLALRFYEEVGRHYDVPLWHVKGPEPHVAESVFAAMLDGVDVRLAELVTPDAAVYVDASYEGDLLPRFGVPYAIGREPRELYGETWAGRQPAWRPGKHNFPVRLSPFDDGGRLLPFIREPQLDEHGWPAERLGEGDGGLQAYGFRVCLTDREANRLPFERPNGYDPGAFELLRRHLAATSDMAQDILGLQRDLLPNGKCDVNSIGPFSLNLLDGSNRGYPDGDVAARARVREHHLLYTQSLLYFLANDEHVPANVRAELQRWGCCADEFTDTDGWPHQLYVRDGRRMLGAHVLTEHDVLDARPQPDEVARGSYNIDIREVERTWRYLPEYVREAAVFNEGYLSVGVPPYPIPYRCLTPRREDATNLLVPVCLSASHVAFGSVRMEPTLMMLGEVAGRAAAEAARRGIAVQDVEASFVPVG